MLLAVVELQQLPLLLLLKFHVHKKCSRAAAFVVVRHRVPDDAICCCGFFAPDSSVSFSLFDHDFVNVPLGSTVACTASICLLDYFEVYS